MRKVSGRHGAHSRSRAAQLGLKKCAPLVTNRGTASFYWLNLLIPKGLLMKRTISALLVIGLIGLSAPATHAADTKQGMRAVKIVKKTAKRSNIKYPPKSITAAYVTMDTTTVLNPIDTKTATTPVDTRTAIVPAVAPLAAPSLSGEQLIKILELFAKLSANTSTNTNTTSNNVLTPITVAPQVITQTIVSPTVTAPTTINQPVTISQPLPIVAQALALLGQSEHENESHENHK